MKVISMRTMLFTGLFSAPRTAWHLIVVLFFFFQFYLFLLYNIVLVLPYVDMNPPWVFLNEWMQKNANKTCISVQLVQVNRHLDSVHVGILHRVSLFQRAIYNRAHARSLKNP